MSCLALTKEGKPCKNPAYYENCCYLKDHQLQVAEMKLQKLKEEKMRITEAFSKMTELRWWRNLIETKQKENEHLRAENKDLRNEINKLKMGQLSPFRLDAETKDNLMRTIECMGHSYNGAYFSKPEGKKYYKEYSDRYYQVLAMYWRKQHDKYIGPLPRFAGDIWPEGYVLNNSN